MRGYIGRMQRTRGIYLGVFLHRMRACSIYIYMLGCLFGWVMVRFKTRGL